MNYDPSAISSGTYYLRIAARDSVGNTSPGSTLYIFRYEDPANQDDEPIDLPGDSIYNSATKGNEQDDSNGANHDILLGIKGHIAIWISCGIAVVFIHLYYRRKRMNSF
jgi:hypothetical protein